MKKILLVGQFTDNFRKMNKSLIEKYEVRACVNKLEIFRGMFKLNKPDIVVLLIEELDKTNEEFLRELKKEFLIPSTIKQTKDDFEFLSDAAKKSGI